MSFIPALISGISAVAGGLLNKGQSTSPNLSPEDAAFKKMLQDKFTANLDPNNPNGNIAAGVNDIAQGHDIQAKQIQEIMAAHGIAGPAVGTSLINNEANRIGDINKFRQTQSAANLNSAGQFFNQTNTGTKTSGNVLGGALGNLGPVLAYLYGKGAFGGGGGGSIQGTTPGGLIPSGGSTPVAEGDGF